MGRSRGLGQKLHGRGLNRKLTKGASTSHFFSFTTAIDQGMTSVNQPQCLDPGIENNRDVLISAPTSQNPTATFRNRRQHLEINPNVSNPVPTSQNQPAATSRNPPMGTLEPWPSILTIYYLACLKNYISKYSIITFIFIFYWNIHFFRLCTRRMNCWYLIHTPYKLTQLVEKWRYSLQMEKVSGSHPSISTSTLL